MPTRPRPTSADGRAPRAPASRVLGVLAWAVAAVVAGTLAWWAVSLVGSTAGRTGEVLSAAEVTAALEAEREALATSPATPDPTPTDPAPTSPTGAPDPTTPPAAGDVARTWDVPGGQVATVCRGESVSLLYATPLDGWTVVVADAGPDDVEVEFRRGEAETRVRVDCDDGVPDVDIDADRD